MQTKTTNAGNEQATGAGGTQATQGTDLHRSKIPPEDPRLRIDRPRARTLRKGPVLVAVVAVALVVVVALVIALTGSSGAPAGGKKEQREPETAMPTAASDEPRSLRYQQVVAGSSPDPEKPNDFCGVDGT